MEKRNLLNLSELLNGDCNQLRYVNRYSTTRVTVKETVAEHSFFTAFFALLIGGALRESGTHVDTGVLLSKALLHDIEEQFTGDIVRPVKHSFKGLKEILDTVSRGLVVSFFEKIFQNRKAGNTMYENWMFSKDVSVEGLIVTFSDFLSVLSYLNQEIAGGNMLVMRNVRSLSEYQKLFENPAYGFLGDLVEQSRGVVDKLLEIKGGYSVIPI